MEIHRYEAPFELLHHERYTVDEAARLLNINVNIIRHAAFAGELPARILGHHILSLRRADVMTWCLERSRPDETRL